MRLVDIERDSNYLLNYYSRTKYFELHESFYPSRGYVYKASSWTDPIVNGWYQDILKLLKDLVKK